MSFSWIHVRQYNFLTVCTIRYDDCFILESVDNKDQWGRYSYVGIDPKCEYILDKHVVTVKEKGKADKSVKVDDPIAFFSEIIEGHKSPRFNNYPKLTGGLIGFFAYDMIRYFEKTLCNPPEDDLKLPDADLHSLKRSLLTITFQTRL